MIALKQFIGMIFGSFVDLKAEYCFNSFFGKFGTKKGFISKIKESTRMPHSVLSFIRKYQGLDHFDLLEQFCQPRPCLNNTTTVQCRNYKQKFPMWQITDLDLLYVMEWIYIITEEKVRPIQWTTLSIGDLFFAIAWWSIRNL